MKKPDNIKSAGFTLVEMAIVLVIIGIILAGVMKGRDIVRGAQVKQFSQQFAQKWGTIAQTYYDKTGNLLTDGTTNGGAASTQPDGTMDGDLGDIITNVVTVLNNVGITPCTLIKSKLDQAGTTITLAGAAAPVSCVASGAGVNLVQTLVEGEYTGPKNVQADLRTQNLVKGTTKEMRNLVVLFNVPTDVAVGLDTAIDGSLDGVEGSCVRLSGTTLPGIAADWSTAAWPSASTGTTVNVGLVQDF